MIYLFIFVIITAMIDILMIGHNYNNNSGWFVFALLLKLPFLIQFIIGV